MNKKILATFSSIALLFVGSISSQTKNSSPVWIKNEPQVTATTIAVRHYVVKSQETALKSETSSRAGGDLNVLSLFAESPTPAATSSSSSEYRNKARKETFYKLLDVFKLQNDPNSVLRTRFAGRMAEMGEQWWNAYYELMSSCQVIKEEEWDGSEDAFWYYCQVPRKSLSSALAAAEKQRIERARDLWAEGQTRESAGFLIGAADCYAKSLNELFPLFYRRVPVEGSDQDFCAIILDSYLHVYDGIRLTPSLRSIPAVAGEPVPDKSFRIVVTRNRVPLTDVPVCCDYNNGGITIKAVKEGVSFMIDEASNSDEEAIFRVDTTSMFSSITPTFALSELREAHSEPAATVVEIAIFDPNFNIYISQTPADSTLYEYMRRTIKEKASNVKLSSTKDDADLILTAKVTCTMGTTFKYGNKQLSTYKAEAALNIVDADEGKILVEKNLQKEFQTVYSTDEQRNIKSAVKYLKDEIGLSIDEMLKQNTYDKRSKIWSSLPE